MKHQKFKDYLRESGETIQGFCARAGISTNTGYKLLRGIALRPCSIKRIVDAANGYLKVEDIKRVWNWNKKGKNGKQRQVI